MESTSTCIKNSWTIYTLLQSLIILQNHQYVLNIAHRLLNYPQDCVKNVKKNQNGFGCVCHQALQYAGYVSSVIFQLNYLLIYLLNVLDYDSGRRGISNYLKHMLWFPNMKPDPLHKVLTIAKIILSVALRFGEISQCNIPNFLELSVYTIFLGPFNMSYQLSEVKIYI